VSDPYLFRLGETFCRDCILNNVFQTNVCQKILITVEQVTLQLDDAFSLK